MKIKIEFLQLQFVFDFDWSGFSLYVDTGRERDVIGLIEFKVEKVVVGDKISRW